MLERIGEVEFVKMEVCIIQKLGGHLSVFPVGEDVHAVGPGNSSV